MHRVLRLPETGIDITEGVAQHRSQSIAAHTETTGSYRMNSTLIAIRSQVPSERFPELLIQGEAMLWHVDNCKSWPVRTAWCSSKARIVLNARSPCCSAPLPIHGKASPWLACASIGHDVSYQAVSWSGGLHVVVAATCPRRHHNSSTAGVQQRRLAEHPCYPDQAYRSIGETFGMEPRAPPFIRRRWDGRQ